MDKVEYDMDTSGGVMEQIQAIIAPPHSAEERKRLIKEKELKDQTHSRRHHGNRSSGRNGGKTINRDCCDSCSEGGDLLCCDRCPASFHFQCCEPPLEEDDIPTGEWVCNECKATLKLEKQLKQEGQQRDETKSPVNVPLPVISKPEMTFPHLAKIFKDKNPVEFSLPLELQDFTVFPGDRKVRTPKPNENGKNGKREDGDENLDRLCFACARFAEPKSMAACDFCPLVFHIDCLHPPMVSPPTALWMCPNHPENYDILFPYVYAYINAFYRRGVIRDEACVKDPRYCVRMDVTDDVRKTVNQNTIVVDFIRRAKRERILSNRKRKVQRRMVVPNAIRQEYKNPTILQLPSYVQRMLEPLPPYARPLSLPAKSEQDEWLKSLVALQCDIANEITKASVAAQKEPKATTVSVKSEQSSTSSTVPKDEAQSDKLAHASDEAKEKAVVDNDEKREDKNSSSKQADDSKPAATNSSDIPKSNDQHSDKQQPSELTTTTTISNSSSNPSTPLPSLSKQSATVISMTSSSSLATATTTTAKKTSIVTSTPKIIILATQSSIGGAKTVLSSSEAPSLSSSSLSSALQVASSIDGPSSTSTTTKSVIIKSSSDSQRIQTSGTPHFVSSITSESLQDPLLSQLDQRLVKVLAFQRLQQLLGQTKAPQNTNKKITASNIQEILASSKPQGHAIAALCPLSGGPTVSIVHRSLNIGQGSDNDVTLSAFGHCNYISSKHACIFFDAETRQFELLNYSEHGTIVDNVLYSCDFSDKPNRNVTSSSAKSDDSSKLFEKNKKPLPYQTTRGHGVESILNACGCRASGSSLIGGSGAGWEGTAVLHHGSFIKFGCLHFVFSIVESATTRPVVREVLDIAVVKDEAKRS